MGARCTAPGSQAKCKRAHVLAEVLALRTILLNALYKLTQGEALSAEEMQRLIERADQDKFRKAHERLAAVAIGGES